MSKIYPREFYLQKLRPFYQSDLIKVITGIRRCGKSSLMLSVMEELKKGGVPENSIVYLNLDKRGLVGVRTAEELEKVIDGELPAAGAGYRYLFIDEIQNVRDFEPLLNAYLEEGNISIFLAGSNSYLLSGELVTKLTGRYVEVELFPLSFPEFLAMKRFFGRTLQGDAAEFREYLAGGGFPKVLEFTEREARMAYLENLISQIFVKDIARRNKVRERTVFERVRTYMINNYGATTSLKRLEEHFKRQEGISVGRETLRRYVGLLVSAKILYHCARFDMKSKKSLAGEEKYYLADTGIYFATNTDGRINYGPALENVLFTYFKSRGYMVSVGRVGKLECDFIVRKNDEYAYVQVAMTIADSKTEEREYAPLERLADGYPKYLFTLDPLPQRRNGIRHLNLVDFLVSEKDLWL